MNRKIIVTTLLALGLLPIATPNPALAESTHSATKSAVMQENIVLDGYSVVSYLDNHRAEKGSPNYSFEYDGQTYLFTSMDQRKAFQENPQKYLPAFGGYCAYGVAKNLKFPVNPKTFKVVGGRTFLFLNNEEVNTYDLWNQENEKQLTRAANTNWENMSGEGALGHYNLDGEKIGLQGYSPVAYFKQGKAAKGNPAHSAEYHGATYYFTSAAEADEFRKNPSKYEPAYGGWCATGMMVEQKFPIDPQNFKIVDHRLFLYKKDDTIDALKIWNEQNESEAVAKADAYWRTLLGE